MYSSGDQGGEEGKISSYLLSELCDKETSRSNN